MNTEALSVLRTLFLDREFSQLDVRDILASAAGMKVSRLCAGDESRRTIQDLLAPYGVAVVLSERKYLRVLDEGKGQWSNRFCGTVPVTCSQGDWIVYLSRERGAAERAREYDAASNHEELGKLLGIPPCCRQFYQTFSSLAFARQGDLLPFTRWNTTTPPPFNFWTNYATQYFGYSLLGFAACSFNCDAAVASAKRVWWLLNSIDPEGARTFLTHQAKSVLYTEYAGVFLLDVSMTSSNEVNYRPLRWTNPDSDTARAILAGTSMKQAEDGTIEIYEDRKMLAKLNPKESALCIFTEQSFADA